jgi:ribonucleoside-diphosphate reductase alpha chain
VNKFAHQRFEPGGMTSNKDIPFAKSLVDYIFRWIGMEFLPGYRDANAPVREVKDDTQEVGEDRLIEEHVERRIKAPGTAPTTTSTQTREYVGAVVTDDGVRIIAEVETRRDSLSEAMRDCQGDAPACDECGTITVRNGTCYRCMNCGHSMGCS